MTDGQYLALEYLFETRDIDLKNLRAIDSCLAHNSYATNGNGWDALVCWIVDNCPERTNPPRPQRRLEGVNEDT